MQEQNRHVKLPLLEDPGEIKAPNWIDIVFDAAAPVALICIIFFLLALLSMSLGE